MSNPYKEFLDEFFSTLLDFRHSTQRLNKVLKKDVEIYTREGAVFGSTSALIISDWSGPTDNGWELNFYTGAYKETNKTSYEIEVNKMISRECCLMYAQSFEAMEKFLKDCLFRKASEDIILEEHIKSFCRNKELKIKREKMPGGDNLFKILKKAGSKTFVENSEDNNLNLGFSELWTILSEARHAITHSRSIISRQKINRSKYHLEILNDLFNSKRINDNSILIELDYHKFDRLIKRLSEFAFQVFKILSIEEDFKWEIRMKTTTHNKSNRCTTD